MRKPGIVCLDTLTIDWKLPSVSMSGMLWNFALGHAWGSKNEVGKGLASWLRNLFRTSHASQGPGGSGPNMLLTMGRLFDGAAKAAALPAATPAFARLFTSISDTMRSEVGASFEQVGIELFSPPDALDSESFIIQGFEDKIIFKNAGNAKEILKEAPEGFWEGANVLFCIGQMRVKIGDAFPQKLLEEALTRKMQIWVTLPTDMRSNAATQAFFQEVITGPAAIVVGNADELCGVYGLPGEEKEQALNTLQTRFREADPAMGKAAFITDGVNGAYAVTAEALYPIAIPRAFLSQAIIDSTGAGDAALGGFLTGWAIGLSPEEAGRLGVAMGSSKVGQEGSSLADPYALLVKADPDLAAAFLAKYRVFHEAQAAASAAA